jgi:hypothetical protein
MPLTEVTEIHDTVAGRVSFELGSKIKPWLLSVLQPRSTELKRKGPLREGARRYSPKRQNSPIPDHAWKIVAFIAGNAAREVIRIDRLAEGDELGSNILRFYIT